MTPDQLGDEALQQGGPRAGLRVGYQVMAHAEVDHLRRLLTVLLKWDATGETAVHFDRSNGHPDIDDLFCDRLHLLEEWHASEWGTAGHLHALRRSLSWWRDRDFDWVVVLSGQDYPIKPVAMLRDHLAATDRNAFIFGGRLDLPERRFRVAELSRDQARSFLQWRKIPAFLWSRPVRGVTRFGLRAANRVAPGGLLVREFPGHDQPFVGVRSARRCPFDQQTPCQMSLDWFGLDRKALLAATEPSERAERLVRWYQRTILPSESFFLTYLRSQPGIRIRAQPLHHIRFPTGAAHPVVFTDEDFGDLASSEFFFARKFDSTSGGLLDRIDQELLRNETRID